MLFNAYINITFNNIKYMHAFLLTVTSVTSFALLTSSQRYYSNIIFKILKKKKKTQLSPLSSPSIIKCVLPTCHCQISLERVYSFDC